MLSMQIPTGKCKVIIDTFNAGNMTVATLIDQFQILISELSELVRNTHTQQQTERTKSACTCIQKAREMFDIFREAYKHPILECLVDSTTTKKWLSIPLTTFEDITKRRRPKNIRQLVANNNVSIWKNGITSTNLRLDTGILIIYEQSARYVSYVMTIIRQMSIYIQNTCGFLRATNFHDTETIKHKTSNVSNDPTYEWSNISVSENCWNNFFSAVKLYYCLLQQGIELFSKEDKHPEKNCRLEKADIVLRMITEKKEGWFASFMCTFLDSSMGNQIKILRLFRKFFFELLESADNLLLDEEIKNHQITRENVELMIANTEIQLQSCCIAHDSLVIKLVEISKQQEFEEQQAAQQAVQQAVHQALQQAAQQAVAQQAAAQQAVAQQAVQQAVHQALQQSAQQNIQKTSHNQMEEFHFKKRQRINR